jgi:hypothetical protein
MINLFLCMIGWHEYEIWEENYCHGDFAGFALAHKLSTTIGFIRLPWIKLVCKHCYTPKDADEK